MDKIQKGVSMAKAEAFNQIVKIMKTFNDSSEIDIEDLIYDIDNVIDNTFDRVNTIKEKHKVDK